MSRCIAPLRRRARTPELLLATRLASSDQAGRGVRPCARSVRRPGQGAGRKFMYAALQRCIMLRRSHSHVKQNRSRRSVWFRSTLESLENRMLPSSLGPNESWTIRPYYGQHGAPSSPTSPATRRRTPSSSTMTTITVRRSTGIGFGPNESWTTQPYYGQHGAPSSPTSPATARRTPSSSTMTRSPSDARRASASGPTSPGPPSPTTASMGHLLRRRHRRRQGGRRRRQQ